MMHRAWSSIVEVPCCFSRSYVKFQGHTALEIVEFDPNWAFPVSNSSLNSSMAMKCCTKLETAKERCPIVFQGHPSNFKVTRDKTPILTQIGRFRTIGRSQLSNPSDLPCFGMSGKWFRVERILIVFLYNFFLWREKDSIGRSYSLNPICCVATVCFQVRCMHWGQLGLFHKDISTLNWHKMVCMKDLVCTFIRVKFAYICFLCISNFWFTGISIEDLLQF